MKFTVVFKIVNGFVFLIILMIFFSACQENKKPIKKETVNEDSIKKETLKADSIVISNDFDTVAYLKKNQYCGEYNFLSKSLLKGNDLDYISPSELRIARNEIFARKAYNFKSPDLQKYFGEKQWYKPLFDYEKVFKELSDIEIKNIEFIKKQESVSPEINKKQQLDTLCKLLENGKNIPRFLAYLYGENDFTEEGRNIIFGVVFPQTKSCKYIMIRNYEGADQSPYVCYLNKYSNEGVFIDQIFSAETFDFSQIVRLNENSFKMTFVTDDYKEIDDNKFMVTEEYYQTTTFTLEKTEKIKIDNKTEVKKLDKPEIGTL